MSIQLFRYESDKNEHVSERLLEPHDMLKISVFTKGKYEEVKRRNDSVVNCAM